MEKSINDILTAHFPHEHRVIHARTLLTVEQNPDSFLRNLDTIFRQKFEYSLENRKLFIAIENKQTKEIIYANNFGNKYHKHTKDWENFQKKIYYLKESSILPQYEVHVYFPDAKDKDICRAIRREIAKKSIEIQEFKNDNFFIQFFKKLNILSLLSVTLPLLFVWLVVLEQNELLKYGFSFKSIDYNFLLFFSKVFFLLFSCCFLISLIVYISFTIKGLVSSYLFPIIKAMIFSVLILAGALLTYISITSLFGEKTKDFLKPLVKAYMQIAVKEVTCKDIEFDDNTSMHIFQMGTNDGFVYYYKLDANESNVTNLCSAERNTTFKAFEAKDFNISKLQKVPLQFLKRYDDYNGSKENR